MKKILYKISFLLFIAVVVASCASKLDLLPTNDLTEKQLYQGTVYKNLLAKLYATLSLTGQSGPAGSPDIGGGLDEGAQVPFIRAFFNHQELTTDMAIVAWNDQTIQDFHSLKWTASDPFVKGMYARPIYNITIINTYLRNYSDAKLAENGITGEVAADIVKSRGEARFLRAFNYWIMLDLFGKSTFITEEDGIGSFLPKEINREDLFKYVESELKTAESELAEPKTMEYGRVDKAAAWALLARLYLNAKVYSGTEHYGDAITYAEKVINSGYSLHPKYAELFMADNDKCKDELIFTANCDGIKTQAYGNTSFFVHAASGADAADYGTSGGWNGYRGTKALSNLFPKNGSNMPDSTQDIRAAHFYTSARKPEAAKVEIDNVGDFQQGLPVRKFVNIRSDGGKASDPALTYADIDFPVFRLAEMYLIYAEATLRGGAGGNMSKALGYVNSVRTRAKAATLASIDLQAVLDERGRELFWEGHRRTDLIRYGMFTTGAYLWPWKGGVSNGTAVDNKFNLFPIPSTNRTTNPNLGQNTGY
ncbi:MAG: RagB/SusD family nutrient uptake outer membrane protein [Niabella sp.]